MQNDPVTRNLLVHVAMCRRPLVPMTACHNSADRLSLQSFRMDAMISCQARELPPNVILRRKVMIALSRSLPMVLFVISRTLVHLLQFLTANKQAM